MWVRPPAIVVQVFAYGCMAAAVLIVAVALMMPSLGVRFSTAGRTVTVTLADGSVVAPIHPSASVTIANRTGAVTLPAEALVSDFTPGGSREKIAAWYANQTRLSAIARAGSATLRIAPPTGETRVVTLHPRLRQLSDLPLDVWLLLGQGAAIGVLGAWLLVLRPGSLAARLFSVASFGILLAAFSGALFDAREVAADGRLLQATLTLNFIGSDVSAAGLASLFMVQPQRLCGPLLPILLIVLSVVAGLFSGSGLAPLPFFYTGLVAFSLATIAVFVLQWLRTERDASGRAVLRWVGVTVLTGTTVLSLGMAGPILFGTPVLGGDGLSAIPLSIVYGGVAFGVGRYRMFDLDRWAFRIVGGALAAMALLAADVLLAGVLRIDGPVALAGAMLVVGYLYLPVRTLVWRRVEGQAAMEETELVQGAVAVAFAPDEGERRRAWRALLQRLFDPLEIRESPELIEAAELRGQGEALAMPALAGDSALVLRFRAKGRRLFTPVQVRAALELTTLMTRAENTREAYTRGVTEERHRIARDLHDDVSARLLTSLHRTDVSLVRSDVRKAMADIRTIVSSLAGEKMALDAVVADLRFETLERLKAADLELSWRADDAMLDARLLDYPTYKCLVSAHREIVSNILQHAQARHVTVSVAADDDRLRIRVEDDGRGESARPGGGRVGNGLRNIRSRLLEIRGDCVIVFMERGARVDLTVPLPTSI